MVLLGTYLNVSDNSGALTVQCIKILGSSFCNHTNVGDTLVVSVKKAMLKKKVTVRMVHRGILIRQSSSTLRKSGIRISFDKSSVVLVKKKNNEPIGSRIKGSVMQEIRYKKCLKIMLLA